MSYNEPDTREAERRALAAGTHEPAVDDFGNQYLARLAMPRAETPTAPEAPQVACPLCRVGIAQQEPDIHLTGDCGCSCHKTDRVERLREAIEHLRSLIGPLDPDCAKARAETLDAVLALMDATDA